MGLLESTLALVLGAWAVGCVCYLFRVPGIRRVLNRLNRFELFASWALAATNDLRSIPGVHTLEFCDSDTLGADGEWILVVATDCWVWHGFLWFPQRLPAGCVQRIGRQLVLLRDIDPLPVKTIAAHGDVLEKLVRRLHPPRMGIVRRVRLRRWLVKNGEEATIVLWQSVDSGHGLAR